MVDGRARLAVESGEILFLPIRQASFQRNRHGRDCATRSEYQIYVIGTFANAGYDYQIEP